MVLAFCLAMGSCARDLVEPTPRDYLPDGTPVTLRIGFGTPEYEVTTVGTRAEASQADEARVHDLYVFIFDSSGNKIYGRFFSYGHLTASLTTLDSDPNEGWWVENKTLTGVTPYVSQTTGAVKVSTQTCSDAKVVVLANIQNAVSSFLQSGEDDDITYLNGISTLAELKATQVRLEQDVVNRKDLFLMMGTMDVENTKDMDWGDTSPSVSYNPTYKVDLKPLDAKVKFLVRCNPDSIDAVKAVYWQVCKTPDRCYLFPDVNDGNSPDETMYFDSEQAYFEGTETIEGVDWYVFTFYMMQNRKEALQDPTSYYDREKQRKQDTGTAGYQGTGGGNFVENKEWLYADPNATYVKFDLILTLTQKGISTLGGGDVGNALTSDTIFSVHLGDFSNSGLSDFNTLRGNYYKYFITINNSKSIYAEVMNDNERQAGQEGFLLLTDDEVVNADCHYEYHSITFTYDKDLDPGVFTWYVKTPFGEGRPTIKDDPDHAGYKLYTSEGLDYQWLKFAVNLEEGGTYSQNRRAYPGDSAYVANWKPDPATQEGRPTLMDINQLIEFVFDQTAKEKATPGSSYFKPLTPGEDCDSIIRATIFIDEYYYEENPITHQKDPDLWRTFVNAKPREMHILSNAVKSRDRQSDVILSSHSVIQQSIQTIYNIYEPSLRTLWGCEHKDEVKEKEPLGWPYWPAGNTEGARAGEDSALGKENGRLNSAYIWGVYSSQRANGTDQTKNWGDILNYEVQNKVPELRDDEGHHYHGMAYSCLTRNRDNNGNGIIDRDEVRWYMAASQQLIGIWVGNEALSMSARLYQPNDKTLDPTLWWRSHVVSSTAKKVSWAEEGAGATDLENDWKPWPSAYNTWESEAAATVGESVRCIRNIGTYDGPSGLADISEAPYPYAIDKYFTIDTIGTTRADRYYTFYFNRLDPKAIREYTSSDLPFHDQNSLHNRVYVKMETQPLSLDVPGYNVKMGDINSNVTRLGYNPYCPEGYRFPNHTEWLLMSLYLPSFYLQNDTNNIAYSGRNMPSRTFFDKGYYGSTDVGDPWYNEHNKVGWSYSNKIHCVEFNTAATRSRCVRDDESMIGNISGALSVKDRVVYPSDNNQVSFNFSSTASAFNAASLKLCYTIPSSGNYREIDIAMPEQPHGLQYRETMTVPIPSYASLGLTEQELRDSVYMVLQAEIRNVSGNNRTFDCPIVLAHPLSGSMTISGNRDKIYPSDRDTLIFNIVDHSSSATLNPNLTLELHYTDGGGVSRVVPVTGFTQPVGREHKGAYAFNVPSIGSEEGKINILPAVFNGVDPVEVFLRATISDTHGFSNSFDSETITLANPVEGSISAGTYFYPAGDEGDVTFDFESKGHTVQLSSATLTLEYTPPGGVLTQKTLSLSGNPSGLTYNPTETPLMPTLHELGLTAADLPLVANLRAEVSTADGLSAVSNGAVTIKSHYSGTVDILDSFDPTNGFPIQIDASSLAGSGLPVQSVKLRWKKEGDANYTEVPVTIPAGDQSLTSNTITAYWHPIWLDNSSLVYTDSTYYFSAEVSSSDANGLVDAGIIEFNAADVYATMEFIKINYNPNPGPWSSSNTVSDINQAWPVTQMTNLNFSKGDFIEAYLDVSNCVYIRKDGTANNDIGMDNLLSIGLGSLNWNNKDIYIYYPAHNPAEAPGEDRLQVNIRDNHDKVTRLRPYDLQGTMKFLLKKDLMKINDAELDYSYDVSALDGKNNGSGANAATYSQETITTITNASTVKIGSIEGRHRSRALYKYVRVVRKHE